MALDGVLDDLDRAAERCLVPGKAAGEGYTWDPLDRDDPAWWPQGVASIRSGRVLLVSWYARRRGLLRTPGSRISVIDRTDPERARYRHVLLVAPHRRLGVLTMGTVPVHAGGIAVHGDVLHVADTLFGVRVFHLGDVLRVPRRPSGGEGATLRGRIDRLRRPTGRSGAHGYDYVLPQLMAYRVPLRSGARRLRYSFLSTGQVAGRPNLVVGEYRRTGKGAPRLARYPLDPRTGLPAADEHGRCTPLEVYEGQPSRMQGAAVHESAWFVTASAGEGSPGDLYVGAPGALHRHRGVLPTGPEDLGWSRPGDELWCVSEWPGRRWIFPIAASRWRPPDEAGHGGP
ncbi:hypothetical protein SAMN06272737_104130 [Blastococcus mobilis]|uniref:Uncharacterized protein n=1 Tax=Blastococcus mobilis TaxID=1938746 RepID=A0A238VQU3_9ACTN|nr:hypothetical protein SAMN06272737_104130 [Blastococcus mobilis]